MPVQKIFFAEMDPEVHEEKNEMIDAARLLSEAADDLQKTFEDTSGFIKMVHNGSVYYFNRNLSACFPDLAKDIIRYSTVSCFLLVKDNLYVDKAVGKGQFMSESEFAIAFGDLWNNKKLPALYDKYGWQPFHEKLIAVGGESGRYGKPPLIRLTGQNSKNWGDESDERTYVIPIIRRADLGISNHTPIDEIIGILLNHDLHPVFSDDALQNKFYAQLDRIIQLVNGETGYVLMEPDAPVLDKVKEFYCNSDETRANLNKLDENMFQPTSGRWDLWKYTGITNQDSLALSNGKKWIDVSSLDWYARDPADDIDESMYVAIDFGTKSTAVAVSTDGVNIKFRHVGGYTSDGAITEDAYENPTILEFNEIKKFMREYRRKSNLPDTDYKWIRSSYDAEDRFQNNGEGKDSQFESMKYLEQLKQWAYGGTATIKDNQKVYELKPYAKLSREDIDPIEIYAYYIGLNINRMSERKIHVHYLLSYPCKYDHKLRLKICDSFKKGIIKSLPEGVEDDRISVELCQCEPVAYIISAIHQHGIMPEQGEKHFCCVYDFGGGTVDFSYGFLERGDFPYTLKYTMLEHGGLSRGGCEYILEELAFDLFKNNADCMIKNKIACAVPLAYKDNYDPRLAGISNKARRNLLSIKKILKAVWLKNDTNIYNEKLTLYSESDNKEIVFDIGHTVENSKPENPAAGLPETEKPKTEKMTETISSTAQVFRINTQTVVKRYDERIDSSLSSFIKLMEKVYMRTMNNHYDKTYIFLAGNASKAKSVKELCEEKIDAAEYKSMNISLIDHLPVKSGDTAIDYSIVPTAKTGVAYGLLKVIPGSTYIDVIDKTVKENKTNGENPDGIGNSRDVAPRAKYYVGRRVHDAAEREDYFELLISADELSDEMARRIGTAYGPIFELQYTDNDIMKTSNKVIYNNTDAGAIRIPTSVARAELYIRMDTRENRLYAYYREVDHSYVQIGSYHFDEKRFVPESKKIAREDFSCR